MKELIVFRLPSPTQMIQTVELIRGQMYSIVSVEHFFLPALMRNIVDLYLLWMYQSVDISTLLTDVVTLWEE